MLCDRDEGQEHEHRRTPAAGARGGQLVALGWAGAAQATELDSLGPIPAVLVSTTDAEETPVPICGVCALVTKPKGTGDTSTTTVVIQHEGEFDGDVELVVWLDTDERVSLWIPAVSIVDGNSAVVEVKAGEGWDWDDVQFAWTRFYSTT